MGVWVLVRGVGVGEGCGCRLVDVWVWVTGVGVLCALCYNCCIDSREDRVSVCFTVSWKPT